MPFTWTYCKNLSWHNFERVFCMRSFISNKREYCHRYEVLSWWESAAEMNWTNESSCDSAFTRPHTAELFYGDIKYRVYGIKLATTNVLRAAIEREWAQVPNKMIVDVCVISSAWTRTVISLNMYVIIIQSMYKFFWDTYVPNDK